MHSHITRAPAWTQSPGNNKRLHLANNYAGAYIEGGGKLCAQVVRKVAADAKSLAPHSRTFTGEGGVACGWEEVDVLRTDKVAAYAVAIERAFIKFIRGSRATRFLTIFGLHLGHCLAVWLARWQLLFYSLWHIIGINMEQAEGNWQLATGNRQQAARCSPAPDLCQVSGQSVQLAT